jgi:hypothetical protein
VRSLGLSLISSTIVTSQHMRRGYAAPLRSIRLCVVASFAWPATRGSSGGLSRSRRRTFSVRIADDGLEHTDRLVVSDVLDLDARGDHLSDRTALTNRQFVSRSNRTGARIFRHDGIQEARRDPALHDEGSERRFCRQFAIVVDRVPISSSRRISRHRGVSRPGLVSRTVGRF